MKRKTNYHILLLVLLAVATVPHLRAQVQESTPQPCNTQRAKAQLGLMEEAFKGCDNLTEVKLPANTEYVGKNAFTNCPALRKVVLAPAKLTTLTETPFPDQDGLKIYVTDIEEKEKLDNEYAFQKTIVIVGEPTSVSDTRMADPYHVSICKNILNITPGSQDTQVSIYDMRGICLAQRSIQRNEQAAFSLHQGVYIVKIGNESIRVLIK